MTSKSSKKQALEYAYSPVEWKPHNYQRRAVKFLLEHNGAGLFLDPGLGKTSISLMALKMLKKARTSDVTLIIAPLRVCYSVWPEEVKKWTTFKGHLNIKVLHGKDKDDILKNAQPGDILCINPEGLEWLFGVTKVRGRGGKIKVILDPKRIKWLFKVLNITDLLVDESTKFKHSSSIRFKILKQVLHLFARRWILTGTPAPNGLLDLFSQAFLMDMGHALGQFITQYRHAFFKSVGFGGFSWVPLPGAEEAIYKLLKPLVLRLSAADYLELPELIENVIRFELPEKARRLYDQLETEFVGDLDAGIVTALNAASAMGKCAQVANGGLYKQRDPLIAAKRKKTDGWELVHEGKNEIVEDLVEELSGQPVLIAYEFDHDLERLFGIFGKDTPYIGGGVSAKEGKRIEDLWNRGKIPVLLVQPASAAHGLNLQGASTKEIGHVVWYGLTYDYEYYDQLIRRVLRQGSKHKKVCVHHIIARDTVDEAKLASLRSKKKGQNKLLDYLRIYVRNRRVVTPPTRHAKRPVPKAKVSKRPGAERK